MRLRHYKTLDGLRAIAALMVMFYHFSMQIPAGSAVENFLKRIGVFGQTGVTLFFVLSGFLITRILLQAKQNKDYLLSFYVRRMLRIFPLYYLYLVVVLLVVPWLQHQPVPPEHSWYFWVYLQNLAYTFNWPVEGPLQYWSLAVEEHFYLFWPLVVLYTDVKALKKVCVGLVVLAILCRWLLLANGYNNGFYFTFTNTDSLAIGGWMALMEKGGDFKTNATGYLLRFAAFFVPLAGVNWLVSGKGFDAVQLVKTPLTALTYFFLLLYAVSLPPASLVHKLLSSVPLRFLGRISYGLYVFHPSLFHYLAQTRPLRHWTLDLLFQFGVSIAVASLSYYGFESAFLRLKRKVPYGKKEGVEKQLSV